MCGAVAPACVVPSMIRFQAKGMGVLHGVPTLCMAAASIDDIIAINGFNIVLTITFSDGNIMLFIKLFSLKTKWAIKNVLNYLPTYINQAVYGLICSLLLLKSAWESFLD